MSASASVAVVAFAAASLLLVALVVRDVARSRRPARLLAAGRLAEEARAAAGALATSWMRVVPGVRDAARYTLALTLHLDGEDVVRPGGCAPAPRTPRLGARAHRHVIEEAALHYLRGAYLVRRGRADEALAPSEGDAEGRASLAPQILSATPSRPPRA